MKGKCVCVGWGEGGADKTQAPYFLFRCALRIFVARGLLGSLSPLCHVVE